MGGVASISEEEDEDGALRAVLEEQRSLVQGHIGDPSIPIDELRAALQDEAGGERRARRLVNLAYLLIQAGHYGEAAEASAEALGLFEEVGDEHGVLVARMNLSASFGGLGDSVAQEQQALALLDAGEETGRDRIVTGALNHLLIVRRRRDDLDGAAEAGTRAVELARKMGLPDALCSNLVSLGNVERDRGDPDRALELYREGLHVAAEHQLVRQEGHALEVIARIAHEQGRSRHEVLAVLDEALDRERQGGNSFRVGNSLDLKARLFVDDDAERSAQLYSEAALAYVSAGAQRDAADSLSASLRLAIGLGSGELVEQYGFELAGLFLPAPVDSLVDAAIGLVRAEE